MKISKQNYFAQLVPVSIFLGFIACGLLNQFFPLTRDFMVLVSIAFTTVAVAKALNKFKLPSEQAISILLTLAFSQVLLNIIRMDPADLAFFIAIILGFYLKCHASTCTKMIKIINFFTICIMIYEVSSTSYLIEIVNRKFEFGRLQGLFSYSKEAGYYVIAATFYLFTVRQLKIFCMLTLLAIAILSGTRTAMLFMSVVILIIFVNSLVGKVTHRKVKTFGLFALASISLLFLLRKYYFVGKSEYMLSRLTHSFNFSSSSHQDRLFIWKSYLEGIDQYNLYEVIFGAGTKLNIILGNGAESFYLMILSQYGLITLVSILCIFILIVTKANNIAEIMIIASLLVILFVGRIGVGWADGILIWAAFFHILDRTKGLQDGAYQVRIQ